MTPSHPHPDVIGGSRPGKRYRNAKASSTSMRTVRTPCSGACGEPDARLTGTSRLGRRAEETDRSKDRHRASVQPPGMRTVVPPVWLHDVDPAGVRCQGVNAVRDRRVASRSGEERLQRDWRGLGKAQFVLHGLEAFLDCPPGRWRPPPRNRWIHQPASRIRETETDAVIHAARATDALLCRQRVLVVGAPNHRFSECSRESMWVPAHAT